MSNPSEPMSTQNKVIIGIILVLLFILGVLVTYKYLASKNPVTTPVATETPLFGDGAKDVVLGTATSTIEDTNIHLAGGPATELSATSVNAGDSTIITWSSPGAVSCVASGSDKTWFFTGGSPVGSFETPPITEDTTYAITCTDKDGNATRKTVLVAVNKQGTIGHIATSLTNFFSGGSSSGSSIHTSSSYTGPITSTSGSSSGLTISLTASKSRVTQGESLTLSWSFSGDGSCTATGAWSGVKATTGSAVITSVPMGNNNYTLACTTSTNQTRSKNLSITGIPPTPTITSFTADAPRISSGEKTTLRWTSVNTVSCQTDISGKWATQSTSLPPNGFAETQMLFNTLSTTALPSRFTLKCLGGAGSLPATQTVTVNVDKNAGPVIRITASPTFLNLATGNKSTITWEVTGGTSCRATGAWSGDKALSGSEEQTITKPGNNSYTLECTGVGGTKSGMGQVLAVLPPPSISMNVVGLTHACGHYYAAPAQWFHISWNTNQEAICKTSGGAGGSMWNDSSVSGRGSKEVLFTGLWNDTFYITCDSGGGAGSNSVSVRNYARMVNDCASDALGL